MKRQNAYEASLSQVVSTPGAFDAMLDEFREENETDPQVIIVQNEDARRVMYDFMFFAGLRGFCTVLVDPEADPDLLYIATVLPENEFATPPLLGPDKAMGLI